MADAQNRKLTFKFLALIVLIAMVTAVAATLAQLWILGKSNGGITGGVVATLTAGLALSLMKKKSGE